MFDKYKGTVLKVLDTILIVMGVVALWYGEYAMAASQFSFVAAMNSAFKREP